MSKALTEIHQSALFDIQEKIAETHELLQREKEFERRHQEIMERRIENAISIGQNLLDFKTTLPHGKFMTFVQTEFGMSQTTANDYMELARNSRRVANLEVPLRSAFELASPSMPPVVIEMVETKQIAPTVAAIREAKREVLADSFPPTTTVKPPALTALQSSDSNEWFTPWEYIDAARQLMGSIDLDPASNEYANQVVQATQFYTLQDSGLEHDWPGNVWLNPPYGFTNSKSNQEIWTQRLIEQYPHITTEAVLLVNANTEAKWFQPLYDYLICLTNHRIRFYNTSGDASQPTQGNALVYFGKQRKRFIELFSQFGTVIERAKVDEC